MIKPLDLTTLQQTILRLLQRERARSIARSE
jgi:hypothetical protein